MLEVCNILESCRSQVMDAGGGDDLKHTRRNIEQYEFNLGKANHLRCVAIAGKSPVCGQCESCQLTEKLKEIKEWFHRLGDFSRKKLMLGLVRRIHSVNLLQQLVSLLQPLVMKDHMYARTRSQPSLETDVMTLSADRALQEGDVLTFILSTWDWFAGSSYWSKANFAFTLLQKCDSHLLHLLYAQAKTLLVSEQTVSDAAPGTETDYLETGSIANTEYSYHTDDGLDLELIAAVKTDYSHITHDPFTGVLIPPPRQPRMHEQDSTSADDTESVDPALMIIPTSSKVYSGVARYVDFISCLPVHLAKCILSYLDKPSLYNALCVNMKWRELVQEVRQEHFVNQSLWEEVMLMQGAAAQGANPVYANDIDVLVPQLHPGTREVVETGDSVIKTTFKSEISFKTAYTGVATRKVIMEERNVYCGAYNVMVLCDIEDGSRVMHTDGSSLIALGSRDRKVRFIDCESGKEQGPVITGHAGSVRCVYLCQDKGLVYSGSYDTSIRCWSIETGQCLKIFRGHTDTVTTILVHDNILTSGAKDKSCKVWNMETGKPKCSFRHRHPVSAIAMSKEICITGCEGGRVKVWELATGELIKNLSGHHGPVTAIKFDRWHIVTGSRDGYALAWSALGHHNRCLTALRHPKEVLCLEFMYLRVITGSGDGRLRIWNMVTGQCCRIMRGNSRSDPILDILAIGDRITLNTHNNLLVLNFEHVDWDYSLETDKVPSLVQYSSYSDAPVRPQPYSYIRAQRMRRAGACNLKLLHKAISPQFTPGSQVKLQHGYHAPQLPHSAKYLSEASMEKAKLVQRLNRDSGARGLQSREGVYFTVDDLHSMSKDLSGRDNSMAPSLTQNPPTAPSISTQHGGKGRPSTVTIKENDDDENSDILPKEPPPVRRRVSWAFDKPMEHKDKTITLSEMKALLRSQIRMKAEHIVPPDFIYLTVSTIQSQMVKSETNRNTRLNMLDQKVSACSEKHRPSSSPSRIDPRTKVPLEELGLDAFMAEDGTVSEVSDLRSIRSVKEKEATKCATIPSRQIFSVPCAPLPVASSPHLSLHPSHVRTTIPKGRVIRPITAAVMENKVQDVEFIAATANKPPRPGTAPVPKIRTFISRSFVGSQAAMQAPTPLPPSTSQSCRPCSHQLTSAAVEASTVPMLMYSKELKERIEEIKQQRKAREEPIINVPGERPLGKVSPFNTPMRSHVKFELKTHEQVEEYIKQMENVHKDQRQLELEQLERKRRAAWLSRVKTLKESEAVGRSQSAPPSKSRVRAATLSSTSLNSREE